ncbi:MAG: HEAT repeat domain-containing protein [Oxalobacteraceae bacterium]|nr:MAG: HEAT repeat domain-containing protein [Oxalobacteraceae bacterium]
MENKPTLSVQKAMSELSRSAPTPLLASTAQLALGGMARALSKTSPSRSAQIVDAIVAQLNKAKTSAQIQQLLLTLGNTGSIRALAPLQLYAQSKSLPLRSTAVNSLRFIESPTAERLLLTALTQDTQSEVRLEAAQALSFRPMTDVSFQLQKTALQSDKNPSVRLALLNNLYVARKEASEFRQLVQHLLVHDPSSDVRQAAERIKAQNPQLFGSRKEAV